MKIAVVFPMDAPTVAWSLGRGIERTLGRMGHEVLAIPMPTSRPLSDSEQEQKRFRLMIEQKKKQLPLIEEVAKCDAVIVSGPEHVSPWIEEVYEKYEWTRQVTCPKAAWLHESMERDDYQVDFEAIQWVANEWFFPAIQDAERYDQECFIKGRAHYLPFGVDTSVFFPAFDLRPVFDVAFIGSLYPKRIAFLTALGRHDHPPIRIGNVVIQDLHGYGHEESTQRYVQNLREVKVLFALPSMSRLIVPRIYEAMACGTFVYAPMLAPDGGASRNMIGLEDVVFYRPSNLPLIAQSLHKWISPEQEQERQGIARGLAEKAESYSIEKRLTEMLAKMKVDCEIEATD